MSTAPESFEEMMAPLGEELGELYAQIDDHYRHAWRVVFTFLDYTEEEIREMMAPLGGTDEV